MAAAPDARPSARRRTDGGMRVAAVQSCYLPWKGFFDLIHDVDRFIFLDDLQYTDRNWRNRNRVKLSDGRTPWLTVPVHASQSMRISEVQIDYEAPWVRKHLETLRHAYSDTPYFERYFGPLRDVLESKPTYLSQLNQALTRLVAGWLDITTELRNATEFAADGARQDRMIDLTRRAGGSTYLSGPSARDYLFEDAFADRGVGLEFKQYGPYPEYPQGPGRFVHEVTVLDLLFRQGDRSPEYIWPGRNSEA